MVDKKCRYMSTKEGSRGTNIYRGDEASDANNWRFRMWMAECVISKDTEEATTPH